MLSAGNKKGQPINGGVKMGFQKKEKRAENELSSFFFAVWINWAAMIAMQK